MPFGSPTAKVTERFTEHDLRAKCASDAESVEHARAMLAHADAKTTELIIADDQSESVQRAEWDN